MDTTTSRTQIERQPQDRRQLLRHHQDQARLAELERVLSECLHHLAAVHGVPTDAPDPQCVLEAKQLLGWRLA